MHLMKLQSLQFEVAMQHEREQQVRAIESDIVDINGIMRELSSMVCEQGEIVGEFIYFFLMKLYY